MGYFSSSRASDFSLSFSPKPQTRMVAQVADHLVPNQVLGFFEFQGERERRKFSVFKGLQKSQIQEN